MLEPQIVRVLLIDSDRRRCESLVRALDASEVTSFRVIPVGTSFEAALSKLQTRDFHVVLLDLEHPDTRGMEGLVAVRHARPEVAIVVLSGSALDEQVSAALKLGADDYLLRNDVGSGVVVRTTRFAAMRRLAERAEERANLRYRQLFRASLDGILVVAKDGSILDANAAALDLLGIDASEARDAVLSDVLPDAPDRSRMRDLLASESGSAGEEVTLRRVGGERRVCLLSAAGQREGDEDVRLVILRDITERKEMEEQLVHDALHDPLTRLPNRILFQDRVDRIQARRERDPTYPLSLLFVDLDRFKAVNDRLGHGVGDELLRRVAAALEASVRSEDTVARVGGDEFALLLDGSDVGAARDAAERILHRLRGIRLPQEIPFVVTASIGIASADREGSPLTSLLADADTAMYRAKATGRGRWQVFDPEMTAEMRQTFSLEADLSEAIRQGDIELFYQPIFGASDGVLHGFEALSRWRHRSRGLLPAASFIPLAEEHGLIVDLGEWVLRDACARLRRWTTLFPDWTGYVSVNLSFKQFLQPDLVERIEEILRATEADPRRIRLELTETTLMRNPGRTETMLRRLQDLGIRLWVDDFGTGYSSLAHLQRLPVSAVKVERSFIRNLGRTGNGGSEEIVRLITSLARTLRLETVAEGVETREQVERLRDLDIGALQGYLLSRPVPVEKAEHMIRRGHLALTS